jgi:hypothetical protein
VGAQVGRILAILLILPLFLFFLPFLTNASDVGLEKGLQKAEYLLRRLMKFQKKQKIGQLGSKDFH